PSNPATSHRGSARRRTPRAPSPAPAVRYWRPRRRGLQPPTLGLRTWIPARHLPPAATTSAPPQGRRTAAVPDPVTSSVDRTGLSVKSDPALAFRGNRSVARAPP